MLGASRLKGVVVCRAKEPGASRPWMAWASRERDSVWGVASLRAKSAGIRLGKCSVCRVTEAGVPAGRVARDRVSAGGAFPACTAPSHIRRIFLGRCTVPLGFGALGSCTRSQ